MMNKRLNEFLKNLNFREEEIEIYLALIKKGPLTTLELSREIKVSRSQVYRFLEKMRQKGLVEEIIDENKTLAKAIDPDHLELFIKDQENKSANLRKNFPDIKNILTNQSDTQQPATKVLFYRGKAGLRQMIWNNLRAKEECVGYTYRRVTEYVGKEFIQKWKSEFIRRNLKFRHVYSNHYKKSLKAYKDPEDYPKEIFEARYIPQSTLDIDHQMDIYNNVVSFYNWFEGEVFGVEIYNKKVSRMQKQLFEMVWKQGVDENELVKTGKAQKL